MVQQSLCQNELGDFEFGDEEVVGGAFEAGKSLSWLNGMTDCAAGLID